MRVTRLSGSEGGGILCDSPYPYSDSVKERTRGVEGSALRVLLPNYTRGDSQSRSGFWFLVGSRGCTQL